MKFPLWSLLTATLYVVAPSMGELQTHSLAPEALSDYLDEKQARYVLPRIWNMAKKLDMKLDGYKLISENPKLGKALRALSSNAIENRHMDRTRTEIMKKRKFPEIDSRGFDEDIFDEGFGDWSPMKRW
ncbi:uncharacterized protein TNCT_557621 [Trichonephila clavata]|uniref:Uncharacterized protein n=1 Tax=Trichonephila clavata TaxID=2740835 RepID=A0A8X6LEQ6_TRICU|nr:uncharacterized protein TNCT_557621 [Trichonephila clavata]